MPEAPEQEVVKDFLNEHVRGVNIESATILKPSVLRPLAGDFTTDIAGRRIEEVHRQAKFIVFQLSDDRLLVVNPMLTGVFQYCDQSEKVMKRTCLKLALSNDHDLRYLDLRQMGRVHYVNQQQLAQVPQLNDLGPDVLEEVPFDEFRQRISSFRGEIKGVLTRGRVISGIGNAYGDEILYAAKVYPYRKIKDLSDDELRQIHEQSPKVILDAIEVVRGRMGNDIHVKIRDFLKVHRKGGEPCPRCGSTISEITANQRITSYCRQCQPGMLIKS